MTLTARERFGGINNRNLAEAFELSVERNNHSTAGCGNRGNVGIREVEAGDVTIPCERLLEQRHFRKIEGVRGK